MNPIEENIDPEIYEERIFLKGYLLDVIEKRLEEINTVELDRFYKKAKVTWEKDIPMVDRSLANQELAIEIFGSSYPSSSYISEQANSFEKYLLSYSNEETKNKRSFLEAEGGLLTAEEVSVLLGKNVKTISRLFNEKKLIGIQKNAGKTSPRYYPAWQFDNGKILAGVQEINEILCDNKSVAIQFMLTPSENIEGNDNRPIDLLRKGSESITIGEYSGTCIDVAIALAEHYIKTNSLAIA